MLNLLDGLLRNILMAGVDQLRPVPAGSSVSTVIDSQVTFGPPDSDWRAFASSQGLNALNVYLVDLRENRKLRTNEHERRFENGIAIDNPAPMRVDCHYLISAWSPSALLTPAIEPIFDEHILLYQTVGVLTNAMPFIPSNVYPATSVELNAWPQRFQNVELPAKVTLSEGFPKLAEFWGTMGMGYRWKPVVYLVVTIPIALTEVSAGPMVTTRITEYRQIGHPNTAEVWIQIGGYVLDATRNPTVPVPETWVQIQTRTNQPLATTTSDNLGRFTFDRLHPGDYQLVWRANGRPVPPQPRLITVPSPTGEYDLVFV